MGQNVNIVKVGGVHADATITLTVREGQGCNNEGIPFTFQQMSSIDYSNSPKDVAIKGTQIAVVTRAVADSDPKWSGEISLLEWQGLVAFLGDGFQRFACDMTVTWQVPQSPAYNDEIVNCFVGDGATTSKSGDAVMVKLGSGCNKVKPNGVEPFATK